MNVKWIDIKDYIKEKELDYKLSPMKYLVIIIIPIFVLIVLSFKLFYYKYYYNEGLVTSKNNLLINAGDGDLNKIINNKKIIINNKEYLYEVKEIGDKVIYQNGIIFQTLLLDINLDKSINFKNYNTKIRILLSKKKIISTIYEIIKGGENG